MDADPGDRGRAIGRQIEARKLLLDPLDEKLNRL